MDCFVRPLSGQTLTHRICFNVKRFSFALVLRCLPSAAQIEAELPVSNARMATYMGFSVLESTQSSTLIVGGGVDYGLYKGVYQCGMYSVFLHGDHMPEDWFPITELGSEILYTIPWIPDRPIRAFYVSCVYECGSYHKSIRGHLQIENLTTMCKWLYFPDVYPLHPKLNEGTEVTWRSHWSVMQHRDVRAGDELKVSFQSCGDVPSKCGINIVYEVDEEDFDFMMSMMQNCLVSAYHDTFRTKDLSEYEKQHEPGTYILGVGADMCNPSGCLEALAQFPNWNVALIRREANGVADLLAKEACANGWSWTSLDACPRILGLSIN